MHVQGVRFVLGGVLLVSMGSLAAGCAASVETGEPEPGVSEDALIDCEHAPKSTDNIDPWVLHQIDELTPPVCMGKLSESPTGSYGNAQCPNQWLQGYGAFPGEATATAYWADSLPTNHDDCVGSRVVLYTYTYDGSWTDTPAQISIGQWSWSNNTCSFTPPTVTVGHGSWHRVGGTAWRKGGLFTTTAKVGVRLSRCSH